MPEHLKLPFAKSLNEFAEKKASAAIQKTGRSLPCSVVEIISSGIVKVKFEVDAAPFTLPNLIVAKWGAEYIRYPTQVGDMGFVVSADARLGGVTGLGAGVASLAQPGNLAALVFNPLGNTAWSSVDPDAVVIYGPNGVVIRDSGSASEITLTPTAITITRGGSTVTITDTQIDLKTGSTEIKMTSSNVEITGALIINGHAYLAHKHSGVQSGGSNSGGVVP